MTMSSYVVSKSSVYHGSATSRGAREKSRSRWMRSSCSGWKLYGKSERQSLCYVAPRPKKTLLIYEQFKQYLKGVKLMKNSSARDFLETIKAQDAWLKYGPRSFFVNGCCCTFDNDGRVLSARLEMYETKEDFQTWIADVCTITRNSVEDCMNVFTEIPLIDGKSFWELEQDLEWV